MKRTLKEYAELLNNHQYRDNFDKNLIQDMKEDGVVVAYGYSDDLFELDGALYEEYDVYGRDKKLYWFGGKFVKSTDIDELLRMVDDEFPMLYDSIADLLKIKDEPYIKITCPSDVQFAYETNFPVEYFNVYNDDELYCKGFVFELNSIKNKGENIRKYTNADKFGSC